MSAAYPPTNLPPLDTKDRHAPLFMETKQGEHPEALGTSYVMQLYRVACACRIRGCWYSSAEQAEQAHARHAERHQ